MTLSIPLSLGKQAVATAVQNLTFTASISGSDYWKAEGETESVTYTFTFNFSS